MSILTLRPAKRPMTSCVAQAPTGRRVMRAASCCVVTEILFTLNMVLTAQNRHEVAAMVGLATRWGVRVCALAT
jgi:hypothetical protein